MKADIRSAGRMQVKSEDVGMAPKDEFWASSVET